MRVPSSEEEVVSTEMPINEEMVESGAEKLRKPCISSTTLLHENSVIQAISSPNTDERCININSSAKLSYSAAVLSSTASPTLESNQVIASLISNAVKFSGVSQEELECCSCDDLGLKEVVPKKLKLSLDFSSETLSPLLPNTASLEISSEICAEGPSPSNDSCLSANTDWSYLSNDEMSCSTMTPLALKTDSIGCPISSSSPSSVIGNLTANCISMVSHDASLGDCSFLSSDSFVEDCSPAAMRQSQQSQHLGQSAVGMINNITGSVITTLTSSPTTSHSEDNDSGLGCNSNDEDQEDDDVDYDGRRISFGNVTVYYFSRNQGFTCVPAQGGSTLGMSPQHDSSESYSFAEYKRVRHTRKRAMLAAKVSSGLIHPDLEPINVDEIDDSYFLEVVPLKKRRKILRESGVSEIDISEYRECETIRTSREECGCNCRFVCDPRTCLCSLNGIKCQVDRQSYPCGCTKDGCGNQAGRIEFNLHRVRTHFFFTLLRVQSPFNKQQNFGCSNSGANDSEDESPGVVSSSSVVETGSVGERGECNNRCCLGVASRTTTYPDESHSRYISEFYNANRGTSSTPEHSSVNISNPGSLTGSSSTVSVEVETDFVTDEQQVADVCDDEDEDEEEFEEEEDDDISVTNGYTLSTELCSNVGNEVSMANESLYMTPSSSCHESHLIYSSEESSNTIEFYDTSPSTPSSYPTVSTAPHFTVDSTQRHFAESTPAQLYYTPPQSPIQYTAPDHVNSQESLSEVPGNSITPVLSSNYLPPIRELTQPANHLCDSGSIHSDLSIYSHISSDYWATARNSNEKSTYLNATCTHTAMTETESSHFEVTCSTTFPAATPSTCYNSCKTSDDHGFPTHSATQPITCNVVTDSVIVGSDGVVFTPLSQSSPLVSNGGNHSSLLPILAEQGSFN